MVELQALGGCEPAVCAEGRPCRSFSDLVAVSSEKMLGWELALSCHNPKYLSL